jgi:hypothetical protein
MGKYFQVSPIGILKSPTHEWLMWVAAYNVTLEDEKKQSEQMKARSRRR